MGPPVSEANLFRYRLVARLAASGNGREEKWRNEDERRTGDYDANCAEAATEVKGQMGSGIDLQF